MRTMTSWVAHDGVMTSLVVNLILRDSLRPRSCMMSAPWYLLWCRRRHYVDEDHDELCCPWRRDDVISCWLNINGQLESSVLCNECALVLARVQAATLCWWRRSWAACPEQALPMDERLLTEDLMFCASYIVECTCNCPEFRFSTSLRRWPMRSLWKDAVVWQHADWSIYMVGKLNWNGSCRVGYACSTVVTECVMSMLNDESWLTEDNNYRWINNYWISYID